MDEGILRSAHLRIDDRKSRGKLLPLDVVIEDDDIDAERVRQNDLLDIADSAVHGDQKGNAIGRRLFDAALKQSIGLIPCWQ